MQAMATVSLSGLLSALSGITALLSARWLGAADRGVFAIAVAVSGGILLISSLGVVNTANVLIPSAKNQLTVRRYFSLATRLTLSASLLVVPFASLALAVIAGISSLDLLITFALYCVLALLAGLYRAGLHGWAKHRTAVMGDLLSAGVLLLSATLLMLTGTLTVTTLLFCGALGLAIQSLVSVLVVRRAAHVDCGAGMPMNTLLRLSLPTLGFTIGGWLVAKGDRVVLAMVAGPVEVGVYSTAATLAEIPWLIAAALAVMLGPRIAAGESIELVERYRRLAIAGTMGVGLLLLPLNWWILEEFLGGEFKQGTIALLVLLPAAGLLASSQIDLAACLGVRDTKSGSRVSMVGAATVPVLVPILATPLGVTGCAIASVLTYGAVSICSRTAWLKNVQRLAGVQASEC